MAAVTIVGIAYLLVDGDDTVRDPTIASRQVTFTSNEHRYLEPEVRAIAGAVTIELLNDASGPHDLAVMKQGITIARSLDYKASDAVGAVGWTGPRSSNSTTLDLAPGTYQVVCTLPGHVEAGMVALLIVEAQS